MDRLVLNFWFFVILSFFIISLCSVSICGIFFEVVVVILLFLFLLILELMRVFSFVLIF